MLGNRDTDMPFIPIFYKNSRPHHPHAPRSILQSLSTDIKHFLKDPSSQPFGGYITAFLLAGVLRPLHHIKIRPQASLGVSMFPQAWRRSFYPGDSNPLVPETYDLRLLRAKNRGNWI